MSDFKKKSNHPPSEPPPPATHRDAEHPTPADPDTDIEATHAAVTESQHDRDAALAPDATANALTSDEHAAVLKAHEADPTKPPLVETVVHKRQVQSAAQDNLVVALGQLDAALDTARLGLDAALRAAAVVRAAALAVGGAADELHHASARGLGIPVT